MAETQAETQTETIGFIGLGVMGKPMARNLIKAGFRVVVYNRSRSPVEELLAEGATTAETPGVVAAQSTVIITMLPDSPQVWEVVTGANGVLSGARPGALLIDMSTISPVVTRELAQAARAKGVETLDAPVSGGDVGAQQATLSIMVGGGTASFERARPIFAALGKTITHVGENGAGQVVKACNQIVVALTIEAISEALTLGEKAGVAPQVILDVLSGGMAASRTMELRRRNFVEHDFRPGFRVALHHKDLGIALAAGGEYGVVLPVTALAQQMFQALMLRGQGDLDHTSLLTLLEDLAQFDRTGATNATPKGGGA